MAHAYAGLLSAFLGGELGSDILEMKMPDLRKEGAQELLRLLSGDIDIAGIEGHAEEIGVHEAYHFRH